MSRSSSRHKFILSQSGNTANNAFFNLVIAKRYSNLYFTHIYSSVRHAISAPAWETLEFKVPDHTWVDEPDWGAVPRANSLNREYMKGWGRRSRPNFLFLQHVYRKTLLISYSSLKVGLRALIVVMQTFRSTLHISDRTITSLDSRVKGLKFQLLRDSLASWALTTTRGTGVGQKSAKLRDASPTVHLFLTTSVNLIAAATAFVIWVLLLPIRFVHFSLLLSRSDASELARNYARDGAIPRRIRDLRVLYRRAPRGASERVRQITDKLLKRDSHREQIEIIYGNAERSFSPLSLLRICLEHGTLRWTKTGPLEQLHIRQEYEELVRSCDHLWVTNIDEDSLVTASELASDKWSVLPHPYTPDPDVPFSKNDEFRRKLLEQTKSVLLVCAPASLNWLPDHDKGSKTILTAWMSLRDQGLPLGLVLAKWGRQMGEVQEMVQDAGVADHVFWIEPQPRRNLQRLLASCDVALDQFGLPAFGALNLRCLEQGIPLISRPLESQSRTILGGTEPWIGASNAQDLAIALTNIWELQIANRLADFRREQGGKQRRWFLRRHHPAMTAILQIRRYSTLLGLHDFGAPDPLEWAGIPDFGSLEWGHFVKETLEQPDIGLLARTDMSLWSSEFP